MRSLTRFWDGVEAFVDRLGAVVWSAVVFALIFHVANLVLRTRAWRNILATALPDERVRWPRVFGAYVSGVAVNAVVPARAGDVMKLLLVHRGLPAASYPTLATTLVVETLFDMPMALLLAVWAYAAGHLSSLPDLPTLPVFEWSFLAAHPTETLIALVVVAFAVFATFVIMGRRIRRFWARVADGFAILRVPREYARQVVALQAAGWACRVLTAIFFLQAFHVPASVENALLVLVVQGAATSLPLTPGGIGPKQALTVVVLAGAAAKADLLAFSIGMELAVLVTNLALGVVAMAIMLRGFHFRQALAEGRARHRGEDPAPPG